MKRIQFLITLSVLLSLVSCLPNKMRVTAVRPTEIKDLAYFEPIAFTYLIQKGNKSQYNDSLSVITQKGLTKVLGMYKPRFPLSEKIEIDNDTLQYYVQHEIMYLMNSAMASKMLKGIKITPHIDSIMDARHQRFALAVVASGFKRDRGNYGKQIAKGIGIGILTLGMAAPVPIKSNLTLYGIIFDAQNDEIIFYNETNPREEDPTVLHTINRQFWHLFAGYFWKSRH